MEYIKIGKTSLLKSELTDKKLEEAQKEFQHIDKRIVSQAWKTANARPKKQVSLKEK